MDTLRRTATIATGTFALVCIGFGTAGGLALASTDPTSTLTTATSTVTSTAPVTSPTPIPSPTDVVSTVTTTVSKVTTTATSSVNTVTKTVQGVIAPAGNGTGGGPAPLPSTNPSGGTTGTPVDAPHQHRSGSPGTHSRATPAVSNSTTATDFSQLLTGMPRAGNYGVLGGTGSQPNPVVYTPRPKVAHSLLSEVKKHASAAISGLLLVVATLIVGGVIASHAAVLQRRFARAS